MGRTVRVLAGFVLVLLGVGALTASGGFFGKPLKSFEKEWTAASGELRDLRILSDRRVNISFKESADGSQSVYVKGQETDEVVAAIERTRLADGELTVDLRNRRPNFMFDFGLGFNREEAEVVVALAPDAELENLDLEIDSGSIRLNGARSDQIRVQADSGSIELADLTAGSLDVKADSGSITGSGIEASATIKADSGSIQLRDVSGPVQLHTDSGSIKLHRNDTADTDIQADSGSVYVRLPASFAGTLDLQSDSGKIAAPDSKRETSDFVKVETDSGNIEIEQDGS